MKAPAPRPVKSDRAFCTHSDKTMRGVLRKEMGQSNKYSELRAKVSPRNTFDALQSRPCAKEQVILTGLELLEDSVSVNSLATTGLLYPWGALTILTREADLDCSPEKDGPNLWAMN